LAGPYRFKYKNYVNDVHSGYRYPTKRKPAQIPALASFHNISVPVPVPIPKKTLQFISPCTAYRAKEFNLVQNKKHPSIAIPAWVPVPVKMQHYETVNEEEILVGQLKLFSFHGPGSACTLSVDAI
jgi:hypothetical protein